MNNNAQIFIKSVEQNNISSIAALLATGCFDVNAPLRQTLQTPLWHAAASGRGEIVALLLDADADIDRVNALLETPCHAATRNDHADVVAQLVARGTDLRLRDRHGFTPLDIAILDRNKRITSALLAAGDVAATADRTKLCDAATIDRHIVQLLLDLRVDVSALRAGHSHYTACHLAAWRNAGAVVDALVNLAGVDVDERDSVGRTPCHVAAASRNAAALGALVLAGADFDLRCDVRRSPLHNACRDETAQCVLVLLAVGAEIGARDAFGQTACHVAARFGAELALHALLAVGADFDARDNAGETPRQLAAKRRIAAPTADELECARRHINRTQLAFVRERALAICVALQALELDALRTCEILRHACGPVAPFVHFHDDGEALLRPTMTLLLLLILVLAALPSATAHMKIYYEPSNLPIRSAKSPTDDGEWTIDSTGCGGQSQWGKNGVSDVKLGQVISLKFNYGNGARGDHAQADNRFRVVFVNLDNSKNNTNTELALVRSQARDKAELAFLEEGIDATVGSRPEAFTATVKVPFNCQKCVLAVLDQRNWGNCIDMTVTGTTAPPATTVFKPNECGNGLVEREIGEECEPNVTPCCTRTCKFGAAIEGCPCVNLKCNDNFSCECRTAEKCPKPTPLCRRSALGETFADLDRAAAPVAQCVAPLALLLATSVLLLL